MDDNSRVNLENIYFTDIVPGQKINRVTFEVGEVTFTDIFLDVDTLENHINGTPPPGIQIGTISQANKSGLGWTWAPI
jgi:hypothetical protein